MEDVKLTAIVLTQNEARRIADCLRHLSWVDEILVVDSGSVDGTVEICHQWPRTRVLHRDFDDFSSQRNAGIDAAMGTWILAVDADEHVPEALAAEIQAAMHGSFSGYWLQRVNVILGREMRFGDCRHDAHIRLFKKSHGRYVGEIHETLELRGSTGRLRHSLRHHGFETVSQWAEKMNRYTGDEARMFVSTGRRFRWLRLALAPWGRLLQVYLWRQGYRDGWQGFVYAALSFWYCFVKHLKHRDALLRTAAARHEVDSTS